MKRLRVIAIALIMSLLVFQVASAAGIFPAVRSQEPAPVGLLDVALLLTTVAFFKQQFGMEKRAVLITAFAVSVVIGLSSLFAEQFPIAGPWIMAVVGVVKLFMYGAGGYDLFTDAGPKILGLVKSSG